MKHRLLRILGCVAIAIVGCAPAQVPASKLALHAKCQKESSKGCKDEVFPMAGTKFRLIARLELDVHGVELPCSDPAALRAFFRRQQGSVVEVRSGNDVLNSGRVYGPATQGCGISQTDTLESSADLCMAFAEALGIDDEGCATPCGESPTDTDICASVSR